jgi:beta-lactamase regulating signal transducer with metallopeptidase domain
VIFVVGAVSRLLEFVVASLIVASIVGYVFLLLYRLVFRRRLGAAPSAVFWIVVESVTLAVSANFAWSVYGHVSPGFE